MKLYSAAAAALAALPAVAAAQPVPPPSPALLAQALDRCMTTYAVRLTRTESDDEAIFRQATDGCRLIETQLETAVKAEVGAERSAGLMAQWHATARPNFFALLS